MQITRIARTILALTAGAALAACGPAVAPPPIEAPPAAAPPAEPAALPQARAALAAGQPAVTIALLGQWAADSPAAAELLAAAHMALAEELLAGEPAAPEVLRAAIDRLGLALALAPAGELRRQIADRRAALIAGAGAPAAEPSAAPAARPAPAATPAAAHAPRPQPTPPPAPVFAVAQRKSFEGSGQSGQFASCVDVQILGRGGPVAGAVLEVNNGDHSYQSQTDATGYAGRCGLGASTWSVVLVWTPAGGASGLATTVYLSGVPEQRAAVVFQER